MKQRRLGSTDLEITTIGLGTWAISGAGWGFAWGAQDDDDSIATIRRALELGINWIDTAPVYGLGHAEEIVGRALRGLHERPHVFTKCGIVWDAQRNVRNSLSRSSIRSELEASLHRLGTELIDLYQIHWPIPNEEVEEAVGTLAELRAEGKIRHIGVSNFDVDQMRRALRIAPIVSQQGMYSLVNRELEEQFEFLQNERLGLLVYSTMMSGLLSGAMTRERIAALPSDDWRPKHPEFSEPRLSQNLELVDLLRTIGAAHGLTPGEVAIAWTLRTSAITAAAVGGRRPNQLNGVVGAAEFVLSSDELGKLDAFLAGYEAMSGETHARAFRGEL